MKKDELKLLLLNSFEEDIPNRDVTTELLINTDFPVTANIVAKDNGIFFGQEIIKEIFNISDPDAKIILNKNDGQEFVENEIICSITASVKAILKSERIMLNLLQRLSGIATTTNKFVQKLANNRIKILDTRKTTPLLRFLEKKAVVAGGGANHRENLSDMVLIKENHITSFLREFSNEAFSEHLKKFKNNNPTIKIEVEVESIEQLNELDLIAADYILFDNFEVSAIKKGIDICKQKNYAAEIELSGGITLDNIDKYSGLNIQRISVGSLTHSVKAMDLSLLIVN
jgi:nicotinate-nucleotide pyrophosphorylase (carboxylating)